MLENSISRNFLKEQFREIDFPKTFLDFLAHCGINQFHDFFLKKIFKFLLLFQHHRQIQQQHQQQLQQQKDPLLQIVDLLLRHQEYQYHRQQQQLEHLQKQYLPKLNIKNIIIIILQEEPNLTTANIPTTTTAANPRLPL